MLHKIDVNKCFLSYFKFAIIDKLYEAIIITKKWSKGGENILFSTN